MTFLKLIVTCTSFSFIICKEYLIFSFIFLAFMSHHSFTRSAFFIALVSFFFCINSCTPKFDPNAAEKDIYVVYGVLDATDSVQYIRVMKGFLVKESAIDFAKNTDISVKGLKVVLTGNNKTYTATQVDNVPTSSIGTLNGGDFYPFTTLYRLDTKGTNALKEGLKYSLKISNPNDSSTSFQAYSYIPLTPKIEKPFYTGNVGTPKYISKVDLLKPYQIEWKGTSTDTKPSRTASFELRAILYYTKNGSADTAILTSSLIPNGEGVNCQATSSTMCYKYNSKEILYNFKQKMPETEIVNGATVTNVYTYANSPFVSNTIDSLAKSLRFEVTAIDTFLNNYLLVNNPAFIDFNSVKPEYTNITGTKEVYGIFGAINKNSYNDRNNGYILLDECGEYLLKLNGTPKPVGNPCEL